MTSMTGFAAVEKEGEGVRLSIRLRSVNGRFLDIKPHLPPDYFAVESEIKKRIAKSLQRGTVDIYIQRKKSNLNSKVKVTSNVSLAKAYLKSYKQLATEVSLEMDLGMQSLSKVQGVLSVEESTSLSAKEKEFLLSCVDLVVEKAAKERLREGKATFKDLKGLIISLEKEISEIGKHRKQVNSELKDRYMDKIKKLGIDLDEARLHQEIVVQVDKSDITEEVLRLKEHFRSMKELLEATKPVGKRLDFYTQELLREVNTIGSKSQHSGITKRVVEAKGIIERVREIVQNVE
ncbi:MAG: YicC/YloC family endoribonuclease [Bdellovibrionales bacterium]